MFDVIVVFDVGCADFDFEIAVVVRLLVEVLVGSGSSSADVVDVDERI